MTQRTKSAMVDIALTTSDAKSFLPGAEAFPLRVPTSTTASSVALAGALPLKAFAPRFSATEFSLALSTMVCLRFRVT